MVNGAIAFYCEQLTAPLCRSLTYFPIWLPCDTEFYFYPAPN